MDPIQEFLARYQREYDYYERVAQRVAQQLDVALGSAGVRCIVTSRAKGPQRLEDKLRQRSLKHSYVDVDAITADIIDLAGVRVALYFPGDGPQAGSIIERTFVSVRPSKAFPEAGVVRPGKRFSGYSATHYFVRLRESSIPSSERRLTEAIVEIQVASVLMHAWAEVEHDLIYKPLNGELSEDEYATLDELNGLVLSGELALERLQRAGQRRISGENRPFANHFEVAAYVAGRVAGRHNASLKDSDLGRIDLLFAFLGRCQINTPALLAPYIDGLDFDFERRPIAEQIIDQLLAEDSARYPIYESVREDAHAGLDVPNVNYDSLVGKFLRQWAVLESLVATIGRTRLPQPGRSLSSNIRGLANAGLIDGDLVRDFNLIRRIRNNLVHGIKAPGVDDLSDAYSLIDQLIRRFEELQ